MHRYFYRYFYLVLLFIALPLSAHAQAGCSDAGVCTLGGHSSEGSDPALKGTARFVQTFSFNPDYVYFESTPSVGYDFGPLQAELSVNWRSSQSLVVQIAEQPANVIRSGGKTPVIQHVRPHASEINSSYAFGDAKLALTIPLSDAHGSGAKAHLAGTLPLTDLYQDREQDLQSTFGLPSLLAGLSYDEHEDAWSYGGTLAYQTTFGQENALHTTRADDAAIALRLSHRPEWVRSIGLDLSAIYHLADDQLHGTPTSKVMGYEKTKGLTVNLGASTVFALADAIDLSVFIAAPIVGIAHVDGLKRSFVGGISLAHNY